MKMPSQAESTGRVYATPSAPVRPAHRTGPYTTLTSEPLGCPDFAPPTPSTTPPEPVDHVRRIRPPRPPLVRSRLVLGLAALAARRPLRQAAERMWVGFHDDPSYRWVRTGSRASNAPPATARRSCGSSCSGTSSAPERPTRRDDPFDPSYRFDDIDEALRAAQEMDQEVMLTISGTPRWANGGQTANRMPANLRDFTTFARAISSRYSGRFAAIPYVRFWSVWNEPNLHLFLTPQFDAAGGRSRRRTTRSCMPPRTRHQGGQPERADRDRRDFCARERPPIGASPHAHARQVRRARRQGEPPLEVRRLGTPPVPVGAEPAARPAREVAERVAGLTAAFPREPDTWFRRKSTKIWVTEYGHQTRPEDSLGVPYATQSAYIQQSISIARNYPFVEMFIWFVYQDDPGQPWESGLYTQAGAAKGRSPAGSLRPRDLSMRGMPCTRSAGERRRRSSSSTPGATASVIRPEQPSA